MRRCSVRSSLVSRAVEMCVAAPPNVARAIQNFLCTQLQNDVGVRADKHASGCDIAKHRIEDGSVPSTFNRIDPHQNTVNPHELFSNVCAKIIVIYRTLNVNPPGGEGPEQIGESAILGGCVPPRLAIAGRENCHSQVIILRHWRSFRFMESLSGPRNYEVSRLENRKRRPMPRSLFVFNVQLHNSTSGRKSRRSVPL